MSAIDYQLMELAHGKPVKMWTNGVAVGDDARRQLRNTASMPFVFRHLAVMPDVHGQGLDDRFCDSHAGPLFRPRSVSISAAA